MFTQNPAVCVPKGHCQCGGGSWCVYASWLCHSQVTTDTSRLRRLSVFQGKILKHALGFPSVQRVVYSTCSIHKEVWDIDYTVFVIGMPAVLGRLSDPLTVSWNEYILLHSRECNVARNCISV